MRAWGTACSEIARRRLSDHYGVLPALTSPACGYTQRLRHGEPSALSQKLSHRHTSKKWIAVIAVQKHIHQLTRNRDYTSAGARSI